MLLSFKLPLIINSSGTYSINNIYIHQNEFVERGTKLLDIRVDLNTTLHHDCPSINFYRLVAQEAAWIRELYISPRQQIEVDFLMGVFSTERSEEILSGLPFGRGIRLGYAGIIHEVDWYSLDR